MAYSITCTDVHSANGKHYIRFGKREREFNNLAEAKEFVGAYLTAEVGEALLIAKWLEVNPSGNNPSLMEGRTITLDLSQQSNIVRVT